MPRLGLVLALLLIAPALCAQGLGDAAARERQKREKQAGKKPPRVYTGADLRKEEPGKAGGKQQSTSGDSEAAQLDRARRETQRAKEDANPGEDSSDAAAARIAQAQTEVDAAQSAVSSTEARIQELRGRLNPQSTTYIYGPMGSNSANEEAQVRAELNDADRELAAARQALSAAEEALQDARQGRPPQGRE